MDPELERIAVESATKKVKPLKRARSEAELVRTRNSNIMLFFAVTQSCCTMLILLKTFGIL